MEKYYETLKTVGLFSGVGAGALGEMLACLGAETRQVARGNIVLLAGDKPRFVGVVLSGRLHVVRDDYDGNRSLVSAVMPGEIFAEALCCADVAESPVTVVADVDSVIMLVRFSRILQQCPNSCDHHTQLIGNMLRLVAKKTLLLQSRMDIIAMKSIRAKALRYLESFAPVPGRDIVIPFNREELAEFLCVERSALSHELSKMKRDGLIEYNKNRFRLL